MANQRNDRLFPNFSTTPGNPWGPHSLAVLPASTVSPSPSSVSNYSGPQQYFPGQTERDRPFLSSNAVDINSNDDGYLLPACHDPHLGLGYSSAPQTYPPLNGPVSPTQSDFPMTRSPLTVEPCVESDIRGPQDPATYPLVADAALRAQQDPPMSRPPLNAGLRHHMLQRQDSTAYSLQVDPFSPTQPDLPTAGSPSTIESQDNLSHGDHIIHPPPAQPYQYHHYHTPYSHTQEGDSFICRWLSEDSASFCGFRGPLDELRRHFNANHLPGHQDRSIKCLWEGCDYSRRDNPAIDTMRLDSLWRHTVEIHLGIKYRKKVQGV